jgi:hypothetical protein
MPKLQKLLGRYAYAIFQTCFKNSADVRGQGARWWKRGAYTLVREHFTAARNAVIGYQMGF